MLSVQARNLWTQESHANSIQALTTRPEIRNARQFVPIGIGLWLAEEDGSSAGFEIDHAPGPIGGGTITTSATPFWCSQA